MAHWLNPGTHAGTKRSLIILNQDIMWKMNSIHRAWQTAKNANLLNKEFEYSHNLAISCEKKIVEGKTHMF